MGLLFGSPSRLKAEQANMNAPSAVELSNVLKKCGFSGIDVGIRGEEDPSAQSSYAFVMSTAVVPITTSEHIVHVIYDESSSMQTELLCILQEEATSNKNQHIVATSWATVADQDLTETTCVFLPGLDGIVLENLQQDELEKCRTLVSITTSLIWVSFDTHDINQSPTEGLVAGLVRTLATEAEDNQLVSLALDLESGLESVASNILNVAETFLQPLDNYEDEYIEVAGQLHIPRVVDDEVMASKILPTDESTAIITQPWSELGNPRLTIRTAGHLKTLYFEQASTSLNDLGPDKILVEVNAVGINHRDLLIALGQVHDEALGTDVAGVVLNIGNSAVHDLKIGDVIFGIARHGVSRVARCRSAQLQIIPQKFRVPGGCDISYCVLHGIL